MAESLTNRVDLLLLRGIHTVDELPAIVRGLRRADVVLLEFVALQSVAKGWLDVLDHLSNDPAFIARVEADLEAFLKGNFTARIVWELRGLGKRFYLIDKKYRTAAKMERASVFYDIDDVLRRIAARPGQRYHIMDTYAGSQARAVLARNHLTARQVARVVKRLQVSRAGQAPRRYQVAVVQGFAHRIAPELKTLLPGVPIREQVFDAQGVQQFEQYDLIGRVLMQKIAAVHEPLSHKEIDYLLYRLLVLGRAQGAPAATEQTHVQKLSEVLDTGQAHPRIQWLREAAKTIKPIGGYREAELAAKVEALLADW